MRTIVISGALANKCRNGGEAWVRLSWILGLRRLGFDVHFVEQIAPQACLDCNGAVTDLAESINLQYFRHVTSSFGLAGRAVLISDDGHHCIGSTWDRLHDVARSADLLVNISGHLRHESLLQQFPRKAYIDIDPGFTQFWHADPTMNFAVKDHDYYFTIGENIGSADCVILTGGIRWRPIRQPVVLEDWPVMSEAREKRFTTVASWRGAFGPVQFGGKTYGLKVHEFRKYISLPRRASECLPQGATPAEFEIALDIHPADFKDMTALRQNGWHITDPKPAAGDPEHFRRYVQNSTAEFSVAQGIYVDTKCGWFSDRTVRYLASGKPALVQETGFSRHLKSGLGLVAFSSLEEATLVRAHILQNYSEHAAAARAVAKSYFDSDKVLPRFLDEVGVN